MTVEGHPVRQLDDLVHQRARLGIMAILNEFERADFNTIRSTIELTPGNLSQHLSVLEDAGLVKIEKVFEGKRPRSWVKATAAGRRAYGAELDMLRALIERSEKPNE